MSTRSKLAILAGAVALFGLLAFQLLTPTEVDPDGVVRTDRDEARLEQTDLLDAGEDAVTGARDRVAAGEPVQPNVPRALAIRVVNQSTGAPLPEFQVRLDIGGEERVGWTDAEGVFATADALPAQSVTVRLIDHPDLWRRKPEVLTLEHAPASADGERELVHRVEAQVGPTLQLDVALPEETLARDFELELRCWRRHLGKVYVAEAPMRAGDMPWVRFGPWVWAMPTDAEWELRAIHRAGLHRGETTLAPLTGDPLEAVPIEFASFGRLVVELDDPAGEVLFDNADLEVFDHSESVDSDHKWVTNADLFDGTWDGEPALAKRAFVADFIPPGLYRVELDMPRYQLAEDVYSVEQGRTTRETLTLTRRPGLASVSGSLRVKSGGAPPGEVWFVLSDPTHPYQAYAAELERRPSDPAGLFRFEFPYVPAKRYPLRPIFTEKRLVFEPMSLDVQAGDTDLEFVCDDGFKRDSRMRFEVLSAATGKPIPHARIELRYTDSEGKHACKQSFTGGDGSLERARPLESFNWIVRAPRHEPRWGDESILISETDGLALAKIELTAGWGEEIRVTSPDGPVAGLMILVDGEEQGVTDDRGVLRLLLPAPPREMKLGDDAWTIVGGDLSETGQVRSTDWGLDIRLERAPK
jgi:hypothetical protein